MRHFAFLFLTACVSDVFSPDDGGRSDAEPLPESSTSGDSGNNTDGSGGLDASDARAESSTQDSAPCTNGTAGCTQAWDTFCQKLKTCCAGQCVSSWANNGGSECVAHYLSANYCATMRANDPRCDETCVSDIGFASCSLITNNASIYGVKSVSSACMTFWQ
jgi:hypothetical protein